MIYAGIGSREVPKNVYKDMYEAGELLGKNGYTLRSGSAQGSDEAFEFGHKSTKSPMELFIPWHGFSRTGGPYIIPTREDYRLAFQYLPLCHDMFKTMSLKHYLMGVSQKSKFGAICKLHGRNMFQILGLKLNEPVDFVLAYTKGGEMVGGTSVALKLAQHLQIPIYNYGSGFTNEELRCIISYDPTHA